MIAYFALLSLLPLVVLLVALGASFLGSFEAAERGAEMILRNVLYRLPPQVMAQVRALQNEIWSGLSYALLVLWTASKVLSKIESGLDSVFRVERRRPWALRKVFAFGLVGCLSITLVVAVLLSGLMVAVNRFIDTTALAPVRSHELYHVLNGYISRYMIPWSLAVLAFSFVYWAMPARAVRRGAALIAGCVAGSLWETSKLGFTYYVSDLANYTRTYGALAAIVIFLLWVNLSASVLLWGAELAAILTGARETDVGPNQGGAG